MLLLLVLETKTQHSQLLFPHASPVPPLQRSDFRGALKPGSSPPYSAQHWLPFGCIAQFCANIFWVPSGWGCIQLVWHSESCSCLQPAKRGASISHSKKAQWLLSQFTSVSLTVLIQKSKKILKGLAVKKKTVNVCLTKQMFFCRLNLRSAQGTLSLSLVKLMKMDFTM